MFVLLNFFRTDSVCGLRTAKQLDARRQQARQPPSGMEWSSFDPGESTIASLRDAGLGQSVRLPPDIVAATAARSGESTLTAESMITHTACQSIVEHKTLSYDSTWLCSSISLVDSSGHDLFALFGLASDDGDCPWQLLAIVSSRELSVALNPILIKLKLPPIPMASQPALPAFISEGVAAEDVALLPGRPLRLMTVKGRRTCLLYISRCCVSNRPYRY